MVGAFYPSIHTHSLDGPLSQLTPIDAPKGKLYIVQEAAECTILRTMYFSSRRSFDKIAMGKRFRSPELETG
jgi:hypothetical protein